KTDRLREALHAVQALGLALAAEVEDQLAHPEAGERVDVFAKLFRRARERSARNTGRDRLPDVIDRRLVRDRQRLWITAFGFGQPVHLVEECLQLRRAER